ncbi:hypothetical protein GTO27_07010, partial [Candidatus Bathyarchaeota archaeon]|nr:hypothetical protein [Candidatus Bathyarchaeota archaeon]
KMTPEAECLSAQIGQLEGGLTVSFDVCVQDRYINTIWSERTQALVAYMKMFNILLDATEYNVTILSISTIEDFDFSEASKQISFN